MPKVLIVDDERTTVRLLRTILELDGFEVVTASRGEEALALIREQQPDVMLIDYHLADMKGVEVLARLRADEYFARLPVVMTSGLDHQEEALAAGANHFLIKPFEPSQLSAIFRDLVG